MRTWLFPALTAMAAISTSPSAHATIKKFAQVSPGVFRGSQPDELSDYEALKSRGIRTILNLRTTKNLIELERSRAAAAGLSFVSVPMDAVRGPSKAKLDEAVRVLASPELQPVFVHCQLGHDRTGIVVGLYRVFVDHWSPRQAYREMRHFGFDFLLVGLDVAFWRQLERAAFPEARSRLATAEETD